MKKSIILSTTIIFIALTFSTQAQLLKVGIGGGYTTVTSSITIFDSGFHYGGKAVVGIPLFPLSPVLNVYNNPLSKDVESVTTESSFLSAGLGAEFTLLPGPVKPYVGAELLYTSIGETSVAGVKVSGSESKTGLGLGAGAYLTLLPIIDLDLSAHYNMNTLLSSGEGMNTVHVRLNVLISIL